MARRSKVTGGAKLRKQLRLLPLHVTDEIKRVVRDGGDAILADALAFAPAPGRNKYATGTLRKKLQARVSKDGLSARVGSWGKRRARHIHLVEFGTAPHTITMPDGSVRHHPGQAAQPFLLPAYHINRSRIREAFIAAVRKAIARGAT